jgi:hypothetical protein
LNIALSGDWQNDGRFVPDNGVVHFIGADDQQITGASGERFTHLTASKSGGMLKLNTPVTVTGTFTLADGQIDNSSNTITLEKGAGWTLHDGVVHTTVSDVTLEELPSFAEHATKKNIVSDAGGTNSSTISKTSTLELPKQFVLLQNYPNPFNPTTIIRYAIPEEGFVSLKVYDMLGREVATLVAGRQNPGVKSVEFDARNLAGGVYIYRLQSGNQGDLKKLLLLK